ncbi:MAG: hypothetical protein LRY54_00800 [Alphaproteobacteria bacterium]|nr:hypothetical protein [Alphaproteobacteria bacterium]
MLGRYGSLGLLAGAIFKELAKRPDAMALAMGDTEKYLKLNAYAFADDHRASGYQITNEEIDLLLNEPDVRYCGNLSPLQFVKNYPKRYDNAVIAVREAVRRKLGIDIPEASVSMQGFTSERT